MMDTRRRLMMAMGSGGIGIDTDFTAKGDDWIEEGGTFTFNPSTASYPGLYQAEGSTQFGTLTPYDTTDIWKAKRLIIPLGGSLETFHAETECFWVSSDANRMGRLMLCFQDEDGNFLFHIIINDGWGRSNNISIAYFNALNSNLLKFVDAVSVSPYNNVPLRFTLDYDGNKMNIGFSYNGGGFSYKSETYAFPAIANAVVYFAYYPTSNPTPLMNVRSLTMEQT